jgi:hypothetical protein
MKTRKLGSQGLTVSELDWDVWGCPSSTVQVMRRSRSLPFTVR